MSIKFTNNPNKTLYIYCRVSDKSKTNDGVSLSVQSDRGREVSKILGLSPIVIEEQGSGLKPYLEERPLFTELMDNVVDGYVKHIWIDEETRLTRNDVDQPYISNLLINNETTLYKGKNGSVKELEDFGTRLVDMVRVMINQEQINTQVRKSVRSRRNRWNEGYYNLSVTPYGYEKYKVGKGKKLKEKKGEGDVIRQMFNMFSKGKTVIEIQSYLLSKGIKSPRGNHEWTVDTIRHHLRNTLYIGETSYKDSKTGIIYKSSCVPIVDKRIWSIVDDRFLTYKNETQQIRRQKHSYLLSPFLHCGICGSRMRGRKNLKKYENIYYCSTKEMGNKRPQKECCDTDRNKSVNIDRLDNLVWNEVIDTIKNSKVLREMKKSTILKIEGEEGEDLVKKQLKEIRKEKRLFKKQKTEQEKKQKKLWKFYVNDVYKDEKDFKDLLKLCQDKISDLENRIKDNEIMIDQLSESNNWVDWLKIYKEKVNRWNQLKDINQKKEILQKYVQKISVSYNKDEEIHNIDIKLRLHLFNDKIEIISKGIRDENGKVIKPREYKVNEGERTKSMVLTKTKVGRKKSLDYSKDFSQILVGKNQNIITNPTTKTVKDL